MKELSVFEKLQTRHFVQFTLVFFLGLTTWWITIVAHDLRDTIDNNAFTLIYPLLSLAGGVAGLVYAKKWGGFKSILGTALSLFSIGLLAQFFGQAAYAYYIYIKHIDVPYPSIGDLGYFGSVIFYIIGAYFLAKVTGLQRSAHSLLSKFYFFAIPVAMLVVSYVVFLKGYEFDPTQTFKMFLDFGYPLGQAIYVSIAIIALILSRRVMGGIMSKPILFLIFALIFQYFSDFMFLYQANAETWYVGGVNDFMYFTSYFLMTIALVNIGEMFQRIKET